MLLPKYKFFSNIALTTACNFLCNNCQLWQQEEYVFPFERVLTAAANSFVVNLCGGNPLLAPELPAVLKELKKNNKKILLTINGLEPVSLEKNIYHYIDLPVIYLPAPDQASLIEETGLDSYQDYLHLFDYFAEQKKKYLVVLPVNEINIENLPDLYELVCRQKKGLLLLVDRTSPKKELKDHLRYYAAKKTVLLIKEKKRITAEYCQGVVPELELFSLQTMHCFIKLFANLYL